MSLPPALVQHAEQHACFTGCYGSDANVGACLSPVGPLQPLVVVTCLDCLTRVAAPQALLPAGSTTHTLAQQLTDHLRQKRGFRLARSGYHASGPGLWLSFVYYDCGLFLINAERSRQLGTDLDVLQLGLQHKVVALGDPRFRDPRQYRTETVYVNFSAHQPVVTSKQQLLSSPQVRVQAHPGWQKVTLAEFLPLSQQAPGHGGGGGGARAAPPRPLRPGDVCPVCGATVQSRPLLNGSYVGCLC